MAIAGDNPKQANTERRGALPDWYPAWARELADLYYSGTTSMFVLWGNVHDLVRSSDGSTDCYTDIEDFLAAQLFGRWDLVIGYDLGRGLRPQAGGNPDRHRSMALTLNTQWGDPPTWPRECELVLLGLDAYIERNLIEPAESRRSIAFLFNYAQYIIPGGDMESAARGTSARLVRLLRWAQNPQIRMVKMAFVLIADKLNEINERLVESPHVATIEIPLPDKAERQRFVEFSNRERSQASAEDRDTVPLCSVTTTEATPATPADGSRQFSDSLVAEVSNGLSLTSLDVLLTQAARSGRKLDGARFGQLKKSMIERQCQGLIEFIEPRYTLDLLVGHGPAKQRLQEDARWISQGQLDAAPMGYLICGPVGTGKTFLSQCYAGSIGIPCAMLRNFRSKYVGETEGNLQQVLTVLRSLGPVVVVVDEADAALGSRQAEGDSGTSARVFSMIASQMGDTRYRGTIIWMLLTSRPDLLPIDLKRQGRAEVHIPLFYPHDPDEIRQMFVAMAKKNKLVLADGAIPAVDPARRLSGADIESVVLAVKRQAMTAGRQTIERGDVEQALAEFIPSAQGLEKELQDIVAVLECTQLSFLPPFWREQVVAPQGRSRLEERMAAVRQLLE
jgi:SpoVK/Ycf46/Vps4 family AAA+-type ATPase